MVRAALAIAFCDIALCGSAAAAERSDDDRHPLYIVNGQRWSHSEVEDIPEDNILRIDTLPADEQTIARYGKEASRGVVLIDLCYDEEARFGSGEQSFADYIASKVEWRSHHGVQRFVARFVVSAEGRVRVTDELVSTNSQFRRRVLRAIETSPVWEPARKRGEAVESHHLLTLQLPKGKAMPKEPYIILR